MKTDYPAGRRVHANPLCLTPLFASELRLKTGCESGIPVDVPDRATLTIEESAFLSRLMSVSGYSMVASSSSGMGPRISTELHDDEDAPR